MTGWIVSGSLVLLVILIGWLPFRLELTWNKEGFCAALRLAAVPLTRPKNRKPSGGKKRRPPNWPILQSILKNGYPILCRLLSRGRVEALKLHFTSAFSDPSMTAMVYAAAGTALDALVRLGEERGARMDVKAMTDFDRETPVVELHLTVSCRLYRMAVHAVRFGWGFARDCLQRKKEAASHVRTTDR